MDQKKDHGEGGRHGTIYMRGTYIVDRQYKKESVTVSVQGKYGGIGAVSS